MKLKQELAAAAVCAAVFATPASAAVITGIDSDFGYSFSQSVGGVTVRGSVNVDVIDFSTSQDFMRMAITLTNTTPGATAGQNRWTGWGFGITPDAFSGTWSDANDGGMVFAAFDNLPGLGLIEVCIYGGNNCSAGNSGIAEGASDTFILRLNFSNLTASGATMNPFGARFVSVGPQEDSFTFYTATTPPNGVPEPGSIALLSAGLLGFGLAMRRRRTS